MGLSCEGRVVLTRVGPAPSNPSQAGAFAMCSGRVRAVGSMAALLAAFSLCQCLHG